VDINSRFCPKINIKGKHYTLSLSMLFNLIVLILDGIELIFFTVAGKGLRFGFVLETMLITHGCFSYC